MYDEAISLDEIQTLIDSTLQLLKLHNYHSSLPIFASDLVAYFADEAPSGDTITLPMVLKSKWLLVHELVELSELKRNGFAISSQLLFSHPSEVFSAHMLATRWELSLAFQGGDTAWVQKRLQAVKTWLTESLSPEHKQACKELLMKYESLSAP